MAAFNQEDLDFLQARAKRWLEATLHQPLPKEESLSAVLADGQILAKVATEIWKLKQNHNGDSHMRTSSTALGPHPSRSATGWSRLANVEVFLKMCKDIGLPSSDLFSATDVIQEKEIKRLCLCFRALAKKAQAMHLKVPDFDDTSSSLVRPRSTGLVESAKKDLLESTATHEKAPPSGVGRLTIPEELLKEQSGNHEPVDYGRYRGLPSSTSFSPDKARSSKKTNKGSTAGRNHEEARRKKPWAVIAVGAFCLVGAAALLLSKSRRSRTYRVRQGDTLYDISKKVMIEDWRKLHESNPHVADPDLIYPEQTLRLKPGNKR